MIRNGYSNTYPLSPMQEGMLFQHLYDSKSGVNIEQLVCRFSDIEIPALQLAWRQVWQANDVLRLGFNWQDEEQPIQSVYDDLALPWRELDWRENPEFDLELRKFLAHDRLGGFELDKPPLMRLTLIRRTDSDYLLIWSYHHILLDGRSIPILMGRLADVYQAYLSEDERDLKPTRPYSDYVKWLGDVDFSDAKSYWQEQFRGFQNPMLLVGFNTSASLVDSELNYGLIKSHLSAEFTSRLREFVNVHSLSLSTLFQGVWAVALSRYGNTSDIVFGSIRTGRYSALGGVDTQEMVGLLINTLPVRVEVTPETRTLDLLKELRKKALGLRGTVYDHIPLAEIQQLSGAHGSLFETIVAFENFELNEAIAEQNPMFMDWDVELIEHIGYPLSLEVYGGSSIKLLIEYSREYFDDDDAQRIIEHVKTLLESMIEKPDESIGKLEIIGDSERKLLLDEWNNTKAEYPQKCVQELFEEQVERTPDAIAVVFEDTRLTYRELNQRANQLANFLIQKGVKADSMVGIYMERSLEMLIALLGILKAGGAYVPVDPSYPLERRGYILRDSGVQIVLTQDKLSAAKEFEAEVTAISLDGTGWEKVSKYPDSNPVKRSGLNDLAYMIYTSGSTGKPKGAMIEHRGLTNYLNWCLHAYPNDGKGSPVHSSLSFDLTVTGIYPALLGGKTVYLLPENTNIEALEKIIKQEDDFSLIKITPAHLKLLNEQLSETNVAGRTRAFIIGGENLYADHVAFWVEHAPDTLLINEYGPTETVVGCCVYTLPKGEKPRGVIPIGKPIDNTHLYVLDANLQPVPIGVDGELYIGGDGVARGYWQRPELTAERFLPDPFTNNGRMYKTGDQVRWRGDGNMEFIGRLDDQVKIRGYRIELGEIETALEEHKLVSQAAVVVNTLLNEKRLIGYVVGARLDISELRQYMRMKLPEYMHPSFYVVLDKLPLTPNGKVDRKALPEPQADDLQSDEYAPPETGLEKVLAGIWMDLLGLPRVGRNDNFFELGGHSLFAVRLFIRVKAALHVDVPISALFEAPTLGELAHRIDNIIWASKQTSQKSSGGDSNLYEEIIV